MSNYLLVGKPGVGKTTLLLKVVERISNLSTGGFFTQEIREHGKRVGFRVETFSGERGILSHIADPEDPLDKHGPRVGKYKVDIPTFEKIGVMGLENALDESDLIVIDEIGKMELFSTRFREALICALNADKPLIATVMSHRDAFVDALKARPDVHLLEVTLANREKLVDELVSRITGNQ